MAFRFTATALVLTLVAGGCASGYDYRAANGSFLDQYANKLRVEDAASLAAARDYKYQRRAISKKYDSFKDVTSFEATIVSRNNSVYAYDASSNLESVRYFLRATKIGKLPGPPESIQLYVAIGARDWVFLSQAFSDGRSFNVTQIDRNISSGSRVSITEDVAVNLTLDDLRAYSEKPLLIKLEGRDPSRAVVLEVPETYIKAFSDVIEDKPFL